MWKLQNMLTLSIDFGSHQNKCESNQILISEHINLNVSKPSKQVVIAFECTKPHENRYVVLLCVHSPFRLKISIEFATNKMVFFSCETDEPTERRLSRLPFRFIDVLCYFGCSCVPIKWPNWLKYCWNAVKHSFIRDSKMSCDVICASNLKLIDLMSQRPYAKN